MQQSKVFVFLLLIVAFSAKGQLYIKDINNHEKYVIRQGCIIKYKTTKDSLFHKTRIKGIEGSKLYVKHNVPIDPKDLTMIKFRPKKLKRAIWIGGLITYAGIGGYGLYYDVTTPPCLECGITFTLIYVLSIPIVIPSLWLSSEILSILLVPKKEFVLDKGAFEIYTK